MTDLKCPHCGGIDLNIPLLKEDLEGYCNWCHNQFLIESCIVETTLYRLDKSDEDYFTSTLSPSQVDRLMLKAMEKWKMDYSVHPYYVIYNELQKSNSEFKKIRVCDIKIPRRND